LSDDADQLTIAMLNDAGVVLVPGLDFGPFTARRYIRVSYATSMENLLEAVERLRVFFAQAKIPQGDFGLLSDKIDDVSSVKKEPVGLFFYWRLPNRTQFTGSASLLFKPSQAITNQSTKR